MKAYVSSPHPKNSDWTILLAAGSKTSHLALWCEKRSLGQSYTAGSKKWVPCQAVSTAQAWQGRKGFRLGSRCSWSCLPGPHELSHRIGGSLRLNIQKDVASITMAQQTWALCMNFSQNPVRSRQSTSFTIKGCFEEFLVCYIERIL